MKNSNLKEAGCPREINSMEKILSAKKGEKIILLGNEAIVRGALEAGVQFVSVYPGTPSTEVGDAFARIGSAAGVHFEYGVNEKVALEAAAGASFCGLRSMAVMKHFGANVALDALIPFCYGGVPVPLVIMIADDPNCWSSAQSEHDTRGLAFLAHIPIIEPSDAQECKDFTEAAFEISAKFKIPVMFRTTTRVSHQRGIVKISNLKSPAWWADRQISNLPKAKFIKNPKMFVTMPPRVLEMKKELLEKIEKIRAISEQSKINRIENLKIGNFRIGIVASGISYLYVKEVLKMLNLSLPILKIGFVYPLPEQKIKAFIKNLKQVLVAEELEPYLEKEVKILAKEANPGIKVFGKSHLSAVGELKPEDILKAVSDISGKKIKFNFQKHSEMFRKLNPPCRTPDFCPDCYYRLILQAVKETAPENAVFGGDIGCYMIAGSYGVQDYLYCMGSSIGIAHGIQKAINQSSGSQKVVALIGDSTFFHAGIPALINSVFNRSNPLIIVMNNETTGMTGHQPHPGGVGKINLNNETVSIEAMVRACGVKNVAVVDPVDFQKLKETIGDFIKKTETSVIIARHLCWLLGQKSKK